MIKTRLSIAFAALALLAIAQGLFTFWATRTAALHAERSVVSTQMLNHYLELGANKQRLKVWFAQLALARDALPTEKIERLGKMSASLTALQKLAVRDAQLTTQFLPLSKNTGDEFGTLGLLQDNFAVLKLSILNRDLQITPTDQSGAWNELIGIFDRADGRDIRSVLEQAVVRQREKSELAQTDLTKALDKIQVASVLLAFLCSAFGLLAVMYFVKRMRRPFEALIRATTAISLGDYQHRGVEESNDEFGQIARQLDTIAVKLETARRQGQTVLENLELAVAEKTADVSRSHEALLRIDSRRRQFFAEISHELRTPVTVIRGEAEIALRGRDRQAADYKTTLSTIVDASVDLSKRVGDLLELAKSDVASYAGKLESLVLLPAVRAAVNQMRAVAASKHIQISFHEGKDGERLPELSVHADKDRLHQVLMILLDNAVRYSEARDRIEVTVQLNPSLTAVSVVIADEGIGLTSEELSCAFERHYRGDRARMMRPDGAGLGLSIAQAIATAHAGDIELKPRTGAVNNPLNPVLGTQAILTLPVLCRAAIGSGLDLK